MKDYSVDQKFTVTSEDKKRSKEYTVTVTFLPDRSTLSFQKDGKEFPNLTIFNSKDKVTVQVSAGNIPDALESRVEAEVKSLHKDTPSNKATLDNNPPVTTPYSIAAFPTVSESAQNTAAQKTKTLELEVIENKRTILYLVEAKVFVRPSGTKGKWIEAKTERRQYARYFSSYIKKDILGNIITTDILEITYDKFIVAKGGEVTLKIKKKDNDMSAYRHIEFLLQAKDTRDRVAFYIKTQSPEEKQKLILNNSKDIALIIQNRFATITMVDDYKYENDTYQIKIKNFQRNTIWRFSLFPTALDIKYSFSLPSIFVIED